MQRPSTYIVGLIFVMAHWFLSAPAIGDEVLAVDEIVAALSEQNSIYRTVAYVSFIVMIVLIGLITLVWTRRKLSNQRNLILEQATSRLARAERIAGLGSWEGNPVTGTMICSHAFQNLIDISATEHAGYRTLISKIDQEDRSRVTHFLLKAYASDESARIDFRLDLEGRGKKWIECIVQTDRDPFTGIKIQHGVILDITQRKQTEEALIDARISAERANHAKSMFLANMSHELRTPLNAIIGFADTLLLGTFGTLANQKQEEYLTDIRKSGRHLLSVISDILDLAAIEIGRRELQEDWFDLTEAVSDCETLVKTQAQNWKVGLSVLTQPDGAKLYADATQFRQILLNLLTNALKFTPEGGTVDCLCSISDESGLKLIITDTGIGMTADEIELAMNEFGTRDAYLHEGANGTGLGLPITRAMIDRHGGGFSMTSTKGQGTSVTVTLPRERTKIEQLSEPIVLEGQRSSSAVIHPQDKMTDTTRDDPQRTGS